MPPTLDELIERWFIDVNTTENTPPSSRHPNCLLNDWTNENEVINLIDGKDFMADFFDKLQELTMCAMSNEGSDCRLYMSYFRLNDVKLLGERLQETDLVDMLITAANVGVTICILQSGDPFMRVDSELWVQGLLNDNIHFHIDYRITSCGGHHQKYALFYFPDEAERFNGWYAYVGSADLSKYRWDESYI